MLNSFEKTLKKELSRGVFQSTIEKFFNKYRQYNPDHKILQLFKEDYFRKIDSNEKAYWLGWLFADAHLYDNRRITIEISVKDGILFKRFIHDIGLNPSKVQYKRRWNPDTTNYDYKFFLDINSPKFGMYLNKHGLISGYKSNKIRFPTFSDSNLKMAFLLGYFDGDGSHLKTPRVYSNSKNFLKDIINEFDLPSIKEVKKIKDKVHYYLDFGADLFNKLLYNYKRSLLRKRIEYKWGKGKFLFNKKQLQKIIINNPIITAQEIADLHYDKFKVTIQTSSVNQHLKDFNIERPIKYEYYRSRVRELRKEGWSLERIYVEDFGKTGFNIESQGRKFFIRLFKDDPLVSAAEGRNIIERIENAYK